MPRFFTRPGIVLSSICGEYFLVAAKAARPMVPSYARLNESSAFLWRLLESGSDASKLEQAVMEEFEIDDAEQAKNAIQSFVSQMLESGYLLEKGDLNEQ